MKLDQAEEQKSGYNGFLTAKKNYIWAGAMALAWQELKNKVIKEAVKLKTKDQNILEIIQNYNKSNFLKKDLSPDSYYVKSGFGKSTVQLINKEVSTKFPSMTAEKLGDKLEPTDLICYAYIFKKFDFLHEFDPRQGQQFLFNGTKVASFYAKQQNQKKIVFYFYYEDKDNFLIGVKGKQDNDMILFLKSQKELTVDEVIRKAIYSENKGAKRYLTCIDQFQMPLVKIDVFRHIKQLEGLRFENDSCKDCYLSKALQGLKLQINEKGAKMQNYAVLVRKKAKMQVKEPKICLLNKPFWIIMKEKQRHPYLCVKIQNPIEVSKQ